MNEAAEHQPHQFQVHVLVVGAAARAPRLIRLRHECRRSPGQRHHLRPGEGPARQPAGDQLERHRAGRTAPAASSARSWKTAIRSSCAAGARATAIASALARSRGRFWRRSDARSVIAEWCEASEANAHHLIRKLQNGGHRFASPAMTADGSPLLRRNIPQPRRMRGDILDAVFQMHALVRRQLLGRRTRPAAVRSRAGSAAAQSRRRSSGRHCAACSRRNPRRTCIRRSRSARPSRSAAGPCRNIRSSAEVAAPWWSRRVRDLTQRIIANRASRESRMTRFPSICGHASADPCAFSGSFALSFSRSSTIDERTCATLWCGISTLLTRSERSLRSRSTTFSTIIGVAGQRIGLLDIVDAVDQRAELLGVVGRMRRQRDVDEGDQVEAERFAGEVGVIARDHLLLLQPHPPPRALRGRQADEIGQLLVGQPAVVLQRGQHFEVEGVYRDHA